MGDPAEVLSPLIWRRGTLYVLDQGALPATRTFRPCTRPEDVLLLLGERRLRGAGTIACALAYAVVLAARAGECADEAVSRLRKAAPPLVPVFWALAQLRDAARVSGGAVDTVEARACALHADELQRCKRIGDAGAALLPAGAHVVTLGHHGALATSGWGTALGVVRSAAHAGKRPKVTIGEARPDDGARLAAWELAHDGLDAIVVPAAALPGMLARREVQMAVLGAERIGLGGEVVTDLGGYAVALAAAAAGVPLLVAATGAAIDTGAAPEAGNPGLDVVPGALVSAVVTEHGIHRPPWSTSLRAAGAA